MLRAEGAKLAEKCFKKTLRALRPLREPKIGQIFFNKSSFRFLATGKVFPLDKIK